MPWRQNHSQRVLLKLLVLLMKVLRGIFPWSQFLESVKKVNLRDTTRLHTHTQDAFLLLTSHHFSSADPCHPSFSFCWPIIFLAGTFICPFASFARCSFQLQRSATLWGSIPQRSNSRLGGELGSSAFIVGRTRCPKIEFRSILVQGGHDWPREDGV